MLNISKILAQDFALFLKNCVIKVQRLNLCKRIWNCFSTKKKKNKKKTILKFQLSGKLPLKSQSWKMKLYENLIRLERTVN